MKKILLFLIMSFMSISIVNAAYYDEHQYSPDAIYNPNRQNPIRQNVSRMDWWGQSGSVDKWAFEYNLDLNDFPSSGTYSVTGAMYFSNAVHAFSTPLISAGATYCQINNTYNYDYQMMKDYDLEIYSNDQVTAEVYDWAYYGTNVSQLVSFTCENVKIPTHGTMYLNVLFPNDIKTLRVTAISITKSGSTEIVKEQEELNDKLQDSINKQDEIKQEQEKTNEELGELNDNITNSDVDDSSASGFFNNFENNDHGLSGIITAPLNFIKNLNSKTCTPVNVSIPLLDSNFSLPCMSTMYNTHFPELFRIYQIVMFGLIAYRICLDIFRMVKGFKDPDSDKVEVIDL